MPNRQESPTVPDRILDDFARRAVAHISFFRLQGRPPALQSCALLDCRRSGDGGVCAAVAGGSQAIPAHSGRSGLTNPIA